MEVYVKDLARMSPKERRRKLAEMTRVATAHRDRRPMVATVLHAVQDWLKIGRVPR